MPNLCIWNQRGVYKISCISCLWVDGDHTDRQLKAHLLEWGSYIYQIAKESVNNFTWMFGSC